MATTDLATSRRSQSRATSRTGSINTRRSAGAYVFHPFGFDRKTAYNASETLIQSRSASFALKQEPREENIWKKPPPDFRPQCYAPRPPKRNSREAMQPWKYGTIPGEKTPKRPAAALKLPALLQYNPEEEPSFATMFKIPGAWEGKLMFVKEGMYKPDPYQMPKPHDYRGYPDIKSLGLPEFETDHEHDPFNLKFLSEKLDILPGDGPAIREDREIEGQQMAPPKPPQPSWEARLILPKEPFPNKSRAYTRFRPLDRSVHSALMERVEEKLNAQWAKAQLNRQLTMHSLRHNPRPVEPQTEEESPSSEILSSSDKDDEK